MNKKYIYGIIGVVVLVIIGFFAFGNNSGTMQAEASPAELTVLETSVWAGADKDHSGEAKIGTTTVEPGGYVKTGDKGRAFIVAGKAQISLDYNSELVLAEHTNKGSSAELLVGATWSKVEKLLDKGEYVEIKTKNAVASVRGTSYGLYYKGDETILMVTEGTVQFTPLDENGKLLAGKSVFVKAGYKAVRKGQEDFIVSELTVEDARDTWFIKNAGDYTVTDEKSIKEEQKKLDQQKKAEEAQKTEEIKKEEQKQEVLKAEVKAEVKTEIKATTTTSSGGNSGSSGGSVAGSSLSLTVVSPKAADVGSGEKITLSGTGFKDVKTVLANRTSIEFDIVDDTHITIIAGEELPEGTYDITVKDKAGVSSMLTQVLEIREMGKAINEANR